MSYVTLVIQSLRFLHTTYSVKGGLSEQRMIHKPNHESPTPSACMYARPMSTMHFIKRQLMGGHISMLGEIGVVKN